MSAAHKAAPTVLENAKKIETTGTSSRSTAATPKLQDHQRLASASSGDDVQGVRDGIEAVLGGNVMFTWYTQPDILRCASASGCCSTPSTGNTVYVPPVQHSCLGESRI